MAVETIHHNSRWLGRSVLSAGVGFMAGLMLAGAALGFRSEKRDHDFLYVGYAAAIAALCGGLYGALTRAPLDAPRSQPTPPSEWSSWRNFVVARKVQESAEITSFYLQPEDGGLLPSFQPGQFLTLQLTIPGQPRPVIRTYSLSDYAPSNNYYRLSIKREPAPNGQDVPPGIASNFMHDDVQEGTVILAKPPGGRFVLDVQHARPAVLLSNGVGITPMISMAKACSHYHPDRPLWFVHGARNGDYHAFRDEVAAIAQAYPNLRVYYRYSRPLPTDNGHYHSRGYVDHEMLQTIVIPEIEQVCGTTEADYFLCGSPQFMDALRAGLAQSGVPSERVFFESFNKPKAIAPEPAHTGTPSAQVTFAKSGKTIEWTGEHASLLEFAEANGLEPEYSCRAGICLTCMCRLKTGEVSYDEPPTGTPDPGSVLICVSKPASERVVLDL